MIKSSIEQYKRLQVYKEAVQQRNKNTKNQTTEGKRTKNKSKFVRITHQNDLIKTEVRKTLDVSFGMDSDNISDTSREFHN